MSPNEPEPIFLTNRYLAPTMNSLREDTAAEAILDSLFFSLAALALDVSSLRTMMEEEVLLSSSFLSFFSGGGILVLFL